MCGESRTHSLEGVVEGRPSTTTLRFTGLEDLQDTNFHGGFTEVFIVVGVTWVRRRQYTLLREKRM